MSNQNTTNSGVADDEQTRLIITVEGIDRLITLIRQAIHDALAVQVGDVLLENYAIDAEHITISEGHQYSQIDDHCPACDSALELVSLQADTEKGALANARCSRDGCRWTGTAVYRLIDLEGGTDESHESAVSRGEVTPDYFSY